MTVDEAISAALEAYGELEDLGATIEDEWQYVTDLAEAYRTSLDEMRERHGDDELEVAAAGAIAEAIAEIRLITDPNRAIDWLSTFPHVVELALTGVAAGAGRP